MAVGFMAHRVCWTELTDSSNYGEFFVLGELNDSSSYGTWFVWEGTD